MKKKTVQTNKDHPLRNPYAFFWHCLRPSLPFVLLVVTFVVLAAGISQGSNYLFKLIVDEVERGNVEKAVWWGLAFPVVILVVQLLYRGSGFLGGMVTNTAAQRARDTAAEHVLAHGHLYFSGRFAGAIGNKVRNIVNAVDSTIPDLLWNFLDTVVTYIVTVSLIAMVDGWAAVIFVLLVVCLVTLNLPLSKRRSQLSRLAADASSTYQARLIDTITNIAAVRQYTQIEPERAKLSFDSTLQAKAQQRSWFYGERTLLINNLVLFVFAFGMTWLLMVRWQDGSISAGDVVLTLALYTQLTGSLIFIGQILNRVARSYGEIREGLEDIYVPYDIVDVAEAKPLKVTGGQIDWHKVSFRYEASVVFNDFSLRITPGQRVGLVGGSGAGKSTFVSLLLREHDVQGGVVSIDGQNIAKVTQESLRAAIAVVPQEPLLFHRSIKENIAYGKTDATYVEIERAARQAFAHDFIMALPDTYDTLVGERGVKLSGGQKQRVAIARAMLKQAPILVLDEATSALDSESEQVIQKALHSLMRNKTVIAIAHRLSTLREMDRIIVLEGGRVVEDGTHDVLLAHGGIYARLWAHQSGGFV